MSVFFPRVSFGPSRCAPAIMHNDLAQLFSLFDSTANELARAQHQVRQQSFAPRFDVKEAKDSYQLEGELPGIDPKDLSIEFTDEHTLTIKGHSERYSESSTHPSSSAIQAHEDGTATPSEAGSVKSHQPTVEDENAAADTTASEPKDKGKEVETKASFGSQSQPQAEAAAEPQTPHDRVWVSERHVGSFSRSFAFADRVDQDAVKASLRNGILSIVVPKAPRLENRRIAVE